MAEFFALLIVGLIIYLVIYIFAYLPILGIVQIILGEWALGLLYLLPLVCIVGVFLYWQFIIVPKRDRRTLLNTMYGFPRKLDEKESSTQWNNGFMTVIQDGINATSDSDKLADLQQCKLIVDKMSKKNAFANIHRVFRLTGCHLTITDSTNQKVTRIV
jgi:hypothetical protein